MRREGLTLFSLSGFRVRLDPSWILIALLVTWSLSTGFFPQRVQGLSRGAYWLMGILGAAGLFLSIVFHEFCHSVVARRQGLPMAGITLFVFGGIAEMREDPRSPKVEFLMAVAGPLSSLAAFAAEALARMQRAGRTQLLVTDGGRLVGVLSLRDLLGSLELRRQLEGK